MDGLSNSSSSVSIPRFNQSENLIKQIYGIVSKKNEPFTFQECCTLKKLIHGLLETHQDHNNALIDYQSSGTEISNLLKILLYTISQAPEIILDPTIQIGNFDVHDALLDTSPPTLKSTAGDAHDNSNHQTYHKQIEQLDHNGSVDNNKSKLENSMECAHPTDKTIQDIQRLFAIRFPVRLINIMRRYHFNQNMEDNVASIFKELLDGVIEQGKGYDALIFKQLTFIFAKLGKHKLLKFPFHIDLSALTQCNDWGLQVDNIAFASSVQKMLVCLFNKLCQDELSLNLGWFTGDSSKWMIDGSLGFLFHDDCNLIMRVAELLFYVLQSGIFCLHFETMYNRISESILYQIEDEANLSTAIDKKQQVIHYLLRCLNQLSIIWKPSPHIFRTSPFSILIQSEKMLRQVYPILSSLESKCWTLQICEASLSALFNYDIYNIQMIPPLFKSIVLGLLESESKDLRLKKSLINLLSLVMKEDKQPFLYLSDIFQKPSLLPILHDVLKTISFLQEKDKSQWMKLYHIYIQPAAEKSLQQLGNYLIQSTIPEDSNMEESTTKEFNSKSSEHRSLRTDDDVNIIKLIEELQSIFNCLPFFEHQMYSSQEFQNGFMNCFLEELKSFIEVPTTNLTEIEQTYVNSWSSDRLKNYSIPSHVKTSLKSLFLTTLSAQKQFALTYPHFIQKLLSPYFTKDQQDLTQYLNILEYLHPKIIHRIDMSSVISKFSPILKSPELKSLLSLRKWLLSLRDNANSESSIEVAFQVGCWLSIFQEHSAVLLGSAVDSDIRVTSLTILEGIFYCVGTNQDSVQKIAYLVNEPFIESILRCLISSLENVRKAARNALKTILSLNSEPSTLLKTQNFIVDELSHIILHKPIHIGYEIIFLLGQLLKSKSNVKIQKRAAKLVFETLNGSFSVNMEYAVINALSSVQDWTTFYPEVIDSAITSVEGQTSIKHVKLIEYCSALMNIKVEQFLQYTIEYALPMALARHQRGFLEWLNAKCNHGKDLRHLCISEAHNILSFFLIHQNNNLEKNINFLMEIVNVSGNVGVQGLIKSCPLPLMTNLIYEIGQEDLKPLVMNSLDIIRQTVQSDTEATSVPEFIKSYSLGILAQINGKMESHSSTEKKKLLGSMNVFLMMMKDNLSQVIPQIMAILQSCLLSKETCGLSLQVWYTFLTDISMTVLEPVMVEAIIVLYDFYIHIAEEISDKASVLNILSRVVLERCNQELINRLFLFEPHDRFENINLKISSVIDQQSFYEKFFYVHERLEHDNPTVCKHALIQLSRMLNDKMCLTVLVSFNTGQHSALSSLYSILFDILRKYNGKDEELSLLSCECLGLLGAIDPSRLETLSRVNEFHFVDDLCQSKHRQDFSFKLINIHMAKAYRSSGNARTQVHLAYAIQELLKLTEIHEQMRLDNKTSANVKQRSNHSNSKLWDRFPSEVQESLQPLLTSRYHVSRKRPPKLKYPTRAWSQGFAQWIQMIMTDLTWYLSELNVDSKSIFLACRTIIKEADLSIALFLLPHLVLEVIAEGEHRQILDEFLDILTCQSQLPTPKIALTSQQHQVSKGADCNLSNFDPLCCQTVYAVMDHLQLWLRYKRQAIVKQLSVRSNKLTAEELLERDRRYKRVDEFVKQIPLSLLAESSFQHRSYARALLHLEQYFREEVATISQDTAKKILVRMQNIYAKLGEPDSVEGFNALMSSQTFNQQILTYESIGNWTAAQSCYELMLQNEPHKIENHIGLVTCLRNLNHTDTMMTQIKSILDSHPQWYSSMEPLAMEAIYTLGNWDDFEQLSTISSQDTFEYRISSILYKLDKQNNAENVSMNEKSFFDIDKSLKDLKLSLVSPLVVASMESYRRAYDAIVQLQAVHEIEELFLFLRSNRKPHLTVEDADKITSNWSERLERMSASFKSRETVLNVRRRLLECIQPSESKKFIASIMGNMWIQTAKLARKHRYDQTSLGAILHASHLKYPLAELEKAKWLWHRGESYQAISIVTKLVQEWGTEIPENQRLQFAKTKLLMLRWIEETGSGKSNDIMSMYSSLVEKELPQWEKGCFYFGRFYNRLYENEKKINGHKRNAGNFIIQICKYYGRALYFGTKYLFQTLPKLLTLWLDYGDENNKSYEIHTKTTPNSTPSIPIPVDEKLLEERRKWIIQLNKLIKRTFEKLPDYIFLSAFPQIVSRICHPSESVFQILEQIIFNVLCAYPQQAFWHLISVSKSTHSIRASRCQQVFAKMKSVAASKDLHAGAYNSTPVSTQKEKIKQRLDVFLQSGIKLADYLLELSNYPLQKAQATLSMSKDFRNLQRLTPLQIMIPLQSSLTVSFPSNNMTSHSFQPFPQPLPMIEKFGEEIEILFSLQKPKKITMIGSNGVPYIFLCKPKDDLRKDSRLMEFNSMINLLLRKDEETRKRNLHIRTYAVVPLNEECGLIEWVNNTRGFRHILSHLYKSKNLFTLPQEVKALMDQKGKSSVDIFLQDIIPRHPPVFHEWFLETFSEPTRWLSSRHLYASTLAVMSMVGYVVGLGDRHGENILFDELTGACVHVDFNCLFEKGLTFEKPEKVPFRLTHNLVDSLGVTGVEGLYRRCCEETMRVLREYKDTLMTVMETFIHDPLCEWRSKPKASGHFNNKAADPKQQFAMQALFKIDQKLQGCVSAGLPISVEGQVFDLIQQARDPHNLSVMYIGWAAYM